MPISLKKSTVNRELSWLSFNHRVLQEAMDETVPLVERLRFLGIFSNNLDEFFRVRVATMKRIKAVSRKRELIGNKTADQVLDEIHAEVLRQKGIFETTYQEIIAQLADEGIYLVNEKELTPDQEEFVDEYYRMEVAPFMIPIMLKMVPEFPYLRDKSTYLAVKMHPKQRDIKKQYALIEVPTARTSRFVVLPEKDGKKYIMFLDDVIRFNLGQIFRLFECSKIEAYTIKLTRDAELDLDDDVSKGFYERMRKSVKNRRKGDPVRFIYDAEMPSDLLKYFVKKLKIEDDENLIKGGRYHNSKDFMKFPDLNTPSLEWPQIQPIDHPVLSSAHSLISAVEQGDILLHYPYHHFRSMIHYLREAAIHPDVKEIKMTLYRVASQSRIVNALIAAAKNGKSVTVMIELRARFDEENNLQWSKKLQEAGVKVIFGIPDMKVHSKLLIVSFLVNDVLQNQVVIATGNFNESTAKVYGDFALFTSNKDICNEAVKVFHFIERPFLHFRFKHLLVAPSSMRNQYIRKINREIRHAKEGKEASVFIKVNSLVDEALIKKLYQASREGVKIRLIVRGICSLIPGIPGLSENIEVHSIIDRFLEHARVFIFGNSGDEEIYISSADWMERNLDYRVEVSTPIYDPKIKERLKEYMELQWSDNVKTRIIDGDVQVNKYAEQNGSEKIRAQMAQFDLIE